MFSEFETLSEFVELGGLVQHDSQLRVDASGSLSFQVAGVNRADGGQAILLQNLWELGNQGDWFTHTLNLDASMLFEDQLGQEDTLVESWVSSDSVNVGGVELGAFGGHVELWLYLINYIYIKSIYTQSVLNQI